MKRRDLLKTAGLVLGYSLTAGTAAAVMGGCNADPFPGWTPDFITKDDASIVKSIASAIIPGTDTLPGAKDIMIEKFVDATLSLYGKDEQKKMFREGMDAFNVATPNFASLSAEDQLGLIKAELDADSEFMKRMHELSIVGFCTSERGATEVLVFDPIPGGYKAVVPVEEVGGIHAY